MPSSPEKPYHALKGGIDKTKPKDVTAAMDKAKFWYKFGAGFDQRHVATEYKRMGLKGPSEVRILHIEGTIDKWVAGKSSADRLKTHDSLYPILFQFFEKVYPGNSALKHKETQMALARLVKQGFNVDYIPAGGEFMIEGNKLFIKTATAGPSDWNHCNGLWIMLDEAASAPAGGGGAPGGATQRTGGGGAPGGATQRTGGGAPGGATQRTGGGGAPGGATQRTGGGGASGGATPRGPSAL